MKQYQEMLALSKDERSADLKESFNIALHMKDAKTELQKHVGKTLAAAKIAGDIGDRDIAKHAKEVCGEDIRTTLQNVYELTNVMIAIVHEKIALTEEDYDKIGASKLALLSPLLGDDLSEEDQAKLADAVAMLKGDKPASEIKKLTRGEPKEPKAVKEQRERAEKAEAETVETKDMLKSMFENGTVVPVGFLATDIGKTDPLANSAQFKARVKADLLRAMEAGDADTLDTIKEVFGRVFLAACAALGEDGLDFVADVASESAKPAAGQTVETPALEAAAA